MAKPAALRYNPRVVSMGSLLPSSSTAPWGVVAHGYADTGRCARPQRHVVWAKEQALRKGRGGAGLLDPAPTTAQNEIGEPAVAALPDPVGGPSRTRTLDPLIKYCPVVICHVDKDYPRARVQ
jgi:hypothetical protein